jgi:hypothetical protein
MPAEASLRLRGRRLGSGIELSLCCPSGASIRAGSRAVRWVFVPSDRSCSREGRARHGLDGARSHPAHEGLGSAGSSAGHERKLSVREQHPAAVRLSLRFRSRPRPGTLALDRSVPHSPSPPVRGGGCYHSDGWIPPKGWSFISKPRKVAEDAPANAMPISNRHRRQNSGAQSHGFGPARQHGSPP